ncbi:MAG TPA: nitroreductase/quinone reductase family protein [Dehalococcoidia bacterium]|nr:nitroreductase/quinone reductase family protein [Dehalococcoidia bacterium]
MVYLKPLWTTQKVFNPIAMRFGLSGVETLSVRKRRSGELEQVPVIPVEHEGSRYIVSPRGETDWVRNLRAAGGRGQLGRGDSVELFQATEVPVEERAGIIEIYRKKAGRTVESFWKTLPNPADHPTFRLQMIGAS